MNGTRLTPKQKAFVRLYFDKANGNATEAAREAGYSYPGRAGYRLLKTPSVHEYVKKIQDQQDAKTVITVNERQEKLTTFIRNGKVAVSDKIKSIDLLNKMDGKYVQKHEINMNYQGKTDEEIIAETIKVLEARGYTIAKPEGKSQ